MKDDRLKTIRYIRIPDTIKAEGEGFAIDPDKRIPIQLPPGASSLRKEDISLEAIISGMLTIIAFDEDNEDFQYFRSFVLAADPSLPEKLNQAAIAKEQQKDYEFAEELFLDVYHLLPQSASCINLATLYSYRAVDAREKKDDRKETEYLLSARHTLQDGIKRFGENAEILSELASFEAYMGNLEEAQDYLERYLSVAEEGEKKEEMRALLKRIKLQIENDEEIKEAYDEIMLGNNGKAIDSASKFIAKNPKVWNGYFLRAWALRKDGKYSDAKKDLLECIKLGESSGDIYNELSICELEEGNRELAKTYLETAADLDDGNLTVLSNLAYLFLQDGQLDEAREYLEKARFISGDDRIISSLIEEYEKISGEKIGELIHEEIIHNDDEDDGYQAELAEIAKDAEAHHCHHHDHEGDCCCHDRS